MGQGDGTGEGTGHGRGTDTATGILAGSIVACCFLFFMFFIGIPLFIAGVVLVANSKSFDGTPYDISYPTKTAGVVCIVISLIMLIVGIILIVLTCCMGSKSGRGQPAQVLQPGMTTVITTNTVVQPGHHLQPGPPQGYAMPPPNYNQYDNKSAPGYPSVPPPQGAYPQGGQGGYYPQGGYPPHGQQPYYDPNAATQPPPYTAAPSAPPPKA